MKKVLQVALTAMTLTALSAQSSVEEIDRELKKKVIENNNVSFLVIPELDGSGVISFYISMNTHSVALNFDMKKIAHLSISGNEAISPLSWSGDPGGGHHRSGYLLFANSDDISSLKLSLTPGGKFEELVFDWEL